MESAISDNWLITGCDEPLELMEAFDEGTCRMVYLEPPYGKMVGQNEAHRNSPSLS